MARIVITSSGTLGDHAPYVALGRELRRRGHAVRAAFNPAMRGLAEAAGLEAVACGPALDERRARAAASDFDELHEDRRGLAEHLRLFEASLRVRVARTWPALLAACADAELVVCAEQQQLLGARVAGLLGVPWVDASVIPAVHAPSRRASLGRKEGWRAHLSPVVDSCLRAAGIGSEPAAPVGRLLAASSQICEAGTGEERHLTGFWFDGPAPSEGAAAPPRALAFFQKYPRPLVLSYSSQPLRDAPAELAVIVEAARHLGRGLVVQEGWAGFAAALLPERLRGDDLLFVGSIPHDLLFAGAGAVIHHGGIGTLARAIRCSCPMLVAPHGNDQFYNAQRVVALGVGAAFHPLRTSSAEVARLLAERVLSAATGGRVEALAAVLRAEDGPRAAAELIESWLPRRVVPHKGEVARDG